MNERVYNPNRVKASIRLATASDASMLAELRYAFRSGTGARVTEDEAEFVRRCGLWMEERLGHGSLWRCWIAERDGAAMGHLWVQLIEKIPNPTSEPEYHAYITNFYVREEARGQGIGSLLLSAALDWCKAQDVHAAILWPTERSRPLYLRHGFDVRADLLELHVKSS